MSVFCDLQRFYDNYKLKKGNIGFSTNGLPLYYFQVKKSEYPKIIYQSAIHAREYITTYLAMEEIKDFIRNGKSGCVYFIPLLNPDGVSIVENGDALYKANANGVDLNVNFDARWGTGSQNVKIKSSQNYIGSCPFSENETKALRDFTLKIMPDMTLSYHSKGEEIYYYFFQNGKEEERDYILAKVIEKKTGYKIRKILCSAGGYKDWCIEKLHIPSFTVEVGGDELSHPIKIEKLKEIATLNVGVTRALIKAYDKLK